ncbi:MAG: hypothetical protein QXT45_07650 [Candidatus Bilamarchaeaceae archaeon]
MSSTTFLSTLIISSVTALPTPTPELRGAIVSYNNQLYYCDGTEWHQITPPSSGGSNSGDLAIGNIID